MCKFGPQIFFSFPTFFSDNCKQAKVTIVDILKNLLLCLKWNSFISVLIEKLARFVLWMNSKDFIEILEADGRLKVNISDTINSPYFDKASVIMHQLSLLHGVTSFSKNKENRETLDGKFIISPTNHEEK